MSVPVAMRLQNRILRTWVRLESQVWGLFRNQILKPTPTYRGLCADGTQQFVF